jgi:hypothetical protein
MSENSLAFLTQRVTGSPYSPPPRPARDGRWGRDGDGRGPADGDPGGTPVIITGRRSRNDCDMTFRAVPLTASGNQVLKSEYYASVFPAIRSPRGDGIRNDLQPPALAGRPGRAHFGSVVATSSHHTLSLQPLQRPPPPKGLKARGSLRGDSAPRAMKRPWGGRRGPWGTYEVKGEDGDNAISN